MGSYRAETLLVLYTKEGITTITLGSKAQWTNRWLNRNVKTFPSQAFPLLSQWRNTLFPTIALPFLCYLKDRSPTYLLDRNFFPCVLFLAICSHSPNLESHGCFASPHASKLQPIQTPNIFLPVMPREGLCCVWFDKRWQQQQIWKVWHAEALTCKIVPVSQTSFHWSPYSTWVVSSTVPQCSIPPSLLRGIQRGKTFHLPVSCFFLLIIHPCNLWTQLCFQLFPLPLKMQLS